MRTKRYKSIPGKTFLFAEQITLMEKVTPHREFPEIKSSKELYDFMKNENYYNEYNLYGHETMYAVFLNRKNRIVGIEEIGKGDITSCLIDQKKLYAAALIAKCCGVVLLHNHPSQNLSPSDPDKLITKKVKENLEKFTINLIDHIIVGDEGYFSFADEGLL